MPTPALVSLFRALSKGELNCPLGAWEIARHGLQGYDTPLLDSLRGLPTEGVRAVLVAVLAERRAQEEREKQPKRP